MHRIRDRVFIIGTCCLFACAPLRAQAPTGTEHEVALEPGPFSPIPRAAIGPPRTFENDIDRVECFPIHISSLILVWVARAHRTGARLFVVPCQEMLTTQNMQAGVTSGAMSDWWYQATLLDAKEDPRIALRRFAPAGWNMFSNGTVCGERMAYWAMDADTRGVRTRLVARIASLADGRPVASRPLGELVLETDNRWALERPRWRGACTAVEFDAARYGRPRVTLGAR